MPNDFLTGENAAWLEELYARYRNDPASVDAATRAQLEQVNGANPVFPSPVRRSIFNAASAATADFTQADRQARVARLINAYRVHGHLAAQVDPLGSSGVISSYPELDPSFYGLTAADLDAPTATAPLYGMPPRAPVRAILARLRESYCATVGVEFMNMLDPVAKAWVQERFENLATAPPVARETQVRILDMLTRADGFERFLAVKFTGNKRFSAEGAESLIPLLDLTLTEAASRGVKECVIGMAHRGRLNVLLNILQKPPAVMLSEFAKDDEQGDPALSGDVKYHLGYSSDYTTQRGDVVHLSLAFNPSHLEAVNPVVQGRVRAKMDRIGDEQGTCTLPLLIHGDAAFAGQGVNQEVLNLSGLRGYRTGGTVHVVVNNQIGFTTSTKDARSTPYCTAVARMLGIPIFHVNGEDPEAVARIVRLAIEWRQTFHRDVVIDLYCFRKWGHNEADEPAFTQPEMYRVIAQHPGVREVYLRSLVARGVVTRTEGDAMQARFHARLDEALHQSASPARKKKSALEGLWAPFHSSEPDVADTRVPQARLSELLLGLNRVPEGFHPHAKIQRLFRLREEQAAGTKPLDWAAAELLAYATLVTSGTRVRLSGQDVGRGTFSHRHALLVDFETGAEHFPLQHLAPGQAPFEAYNSLLSEYGVLGFEFGYSLDYPDALVIWEAQFGDFANGAQIIIDNFIVSSHSKWNRLSGLTLMLPHGYEGMGPEHSSARIERFLQLAADGNIQVANCTTPAQIFHLLRRQMVRKVRDPLIIFTPKSLLRSPEAVSSLAELAQGSFQRVIPDGAGKKRLVLCSGKVYYDLVAARAKAKAEARVALVRVEELYPFPLAEIRAQLAAHPGATVVWCQEEPKNMGPWSFVALNLLEAGIVVQYAGRPASASPATGYHGRHVAEQAALVKAAMG